MQVGCDQTQVAGGMSGQSRQAEFILIIPCTQQFSVEAGSVLAKACASPHLTIADTSQFQLGVVLRCSPLRASLCAPTGQALLTPPSSALS